MLRPRIIPCLLVHNGGLVKTTSFTEPKYIGDPLNAVRIFNEMAVDELMVIDIDATLNSKPPNEKLIAELAAECRMPFCYGGGVKNVEQVERLISIGVEKVAISSALIDNPELLPRAAERVGSQSIVGVIDVKKNGMARKNTVVTHRGTKNTGLDPLTHAMMLEKMGVGEIVINSVDHDGLMKGYDIDLAESVRKVTNVPLTILGGAGSILDIKALVSRHPIIGAAAGSLFVFKGKFRAVMINYPSLSERDELASYAMQPE
jgi:imidazole glycerol-phosphate synthase subunit HisF